MKNLDLNKVAQQLSNVRPGNIYIAAPLTEKDTIDQISKTATWTNVYDSSHLMGYFNKTYDDCSFYKEYEGEVLSLTEQAILTGVDEFLQKVPEMHFA